MLQASSQQLIAAITNKDLQKIKTEIRKFVSGGVVNVDMALDHGTQLSIWNRQHGKATTAKVLVILITDLVNSFNVNRPMTSGQITDLAMDMAADLWAFRMEEIGAFFEGVKRGTYGKIYERLDPPTIWLCWDLYLDHRNEVIEVRRSRQVYIDPTITQKDDQTRSGGKIERLGESIRQLKDSFKSSTDGK